MKPVLALVLAMLMISTSLFLTSCKKDDPVQPTVDTQASENTAESIAASFGAENGGTVDQVNDVLSLATIGGLKKANPQDGSLTRIVDTSYNQSTGEWTLSFVRTNGNPTGLLYAEISRNYTVKFLNKNGQPQKYFIVLNPPNGPDTAYSMQFKINGGTGIVRLPRLKHKLVSLSGNWTATGLNTTTITINGSNQRSAIDTITTLAWERILTNNFTVNMVNVVVQRGVTPIYTRISGTLNGTYDATVQFQRGTSYSENTIHRAFSVSLIDGTGTITISGQVYRALLATGEIQW